MLKITFEMERQTTLYVKNLHDSIDNNRLRTEFAPYGEILKSKIMYERGRSMGIGYVWFSTPAEARTAVKAMNGRFVGGQPLIVQLAQWRRDLQIVNRANRAVSTEVEQAVLIPGFPPLTVSMLVAATHEEQKQMLLQRLSILVKAIYPELTLTVTDLFAGVDHSDLLLMLEDEQYLSAKVHQVALFRSRNTK